MYRALHIACRQKYIYSGNELRIRSLVSVKSWSHWLVVPAVIALCTSFTHQLQRSQHVSAGFCVLLAFDNEGKRFFHPHARECLDNSVSVLMDVKSKTGLLYTKIATGSSLYLLFFMLCIFGNIRISHIMPHYLGSKMRVDSILPLFDSSRQRRLLRILLRVYQKQILHTEKSE